MSDESLLNRFLTDMSVILAEKLPDLHFGPINDPAQALQPDSVYIFPLQLELKPGLTNAAAASINATLQLICDSVKADLAQTRLTNAASQLMKLLKALPFNNPTASVYWDVIRNLRLVTATPAPKRRGALGYLKAVNISFTLYFQDV